MPSPAPSTPHAQFHESNIYRHGQTFDLSIRSRAPQHVAPASNHATPCDVEISSSGDARTPSFTEQKWKLNKVRHRHDPTMQRAQSPSYRRSRAPSPEMMRTKRTHNQAFPQPLAQHDLDIEKNPHPPYTPAPKKRDVIRNQIKDCIFQSDFLIVLPLTPDEIWNVSTISAVFPDPSKKNYVLILSGWGLPDAATSAELENICAKLSVTIAPYINTVLHKAACLTHGQFAFLGARYYHGDNAFASKQYGSLPGMVMGFPSARDAMFFITAAGIQVGFNPVASD